MFDLQRTRARTRDRRRRRCRRRRRMRGRCLASGSATHVVVKHENHTPTGAFKVRGGLVYLDRLKRERPDTPDYISATRGNHGQSLAFAASRHGVPAVIWCRAAIRSRRTAPCARSAPSWSSMARISRRRAKKPSAAPSSPASMWCRRSIPIWCSGVATYALELFRTAPDLDVSLRADRAGLRHLRLHHGARSAWV